MPAKVDRVPPPLLPWLRNWRRSHQGLTDTAARARSRPLRGLLTSLQVAESGAGYTLSGKELDPTSAAARAYFFGAKSASAGDATSGADSGQAAPRTKRKPTLPTSDELAGDAAVAPVPVPTEAPAAAEVALDATAKPTARTDYSRDRLRPKSGPRASVAFQQIAQNRCAPRHPPPPAAPRDSGVREPAGR